MGADRGRGRRGCLESAFENIQGEVFGKYFLDGRGVLKTKKIEFNRMNVEFFKRFSLPSANWMVGGGKNLELCGSELKDSF